ncbi:hypothetical protein Tco_0632334 [Tanacetum coccineum]
MVSRLSMASTENDELGRHESAGTSRSGYMKLLPGGCAYVIAGTDALIDMNLTENKKKEGNFNSYDLECLA